MSQQIIRQPDGRYAIWSTIVDGFLLLDATRDELIEAMLSNERDRVRIRVNDICDKLDTGANPYFQFTMTWEEAIREHEQQHGPVSRLKEG